MRMLGWFAGILRGSFHSSLLGVVVTCLMVFVPTTVVAQTAADTQGNTDGTTIGKRQVREVMAGVRAWQEKVATVSYEASWTNKPRPGGRSAAPTSVIVERTPRATALTLGTGSSARVILVDDAYTTNLSVGSSKRVVNPREMGLGQLAQYDPLSVFFLLPADMKNPGSKTVTLAEVLRAEADVTTWTETAPMQYRATTEAWSVLWEFSQRAGARVVSFELPPGEGRGLARVFEFSYNETSPLPVSMRESARASDGETRVLREAIITMLAAKPFGEYPGPFRFTAEPGQVIDDYTGESAPNRAPVRGAPAR